MRKLLRVALLLVAMLSMNGAFAQVLILFGVDGFKLSDRADNMVQANSFTMGFVDSTVSVQSTTATGVASRTTVPGTRTAQDAVLTMPMGNAAVLLSRAVMGGQLFPRATVQFMPANARNPIFQVQLFDVLVTSAVIGKSGNDGGPGFVEIKLRASRYEMFNNNQDSRGAVSPGAKAVIDVRGGKVY